MKVSIGLYRHNKVDVSLYELNNSDNPPLHILVYIL